MILDKPVKDLAETDLQDHVTNQIPEGVTIEYKEKLLLDKPDDKKEFLRDITAFANTRDRKRG
jgi:hypothetical protein